MPGWAKLTHYNSVKITKLVLYGSLCVSFVLTAMLIAYDLHFNSLRLRTIIGFVVFAYLAICIFLVNKKYVAITNYILIALYAAIAFSTMLYWGINAAAGIFATSFVIILSGILLGSRLILPVSIGLSILLIVIQVIHDTGTVIPNLTPLHDQSTYLDVLSYASILGVFALITWASNSQIEKTLKRAKIAESLLRNQKDTLHTELEKESARLREIQLKELQQLYKFATLGQTTAATLHELSNHLSILNMDIDDLKQQNKNSQAILNAKEGIEHINSMMRQIKRKLHNYDDTKTFKVGVVIRRVLKDLNEKFKSKPVKLSYAQSNIGDLQIAGDPLALAQILTVLITNALDACADLPNAKVTIALKQSKTNIHISVTDNGIGISESVLKKLFHPILSSKPSGMGIGLYIAQRLAESQLNGKITVKTPASSQLADTQFVITLPLES